MYNYKQRNYDIGILYTYCNTSNMQDMTSTSILTSSYITNTTIVCVWIYFILLFIHCWLSSYDVYTW